MCTGLEIAAVAGGVLSGVSTLKQMGASKDATKAQNRALDLQRRSDELKQNRERRQVIREARIKRATIEQSGANQGATESSAVSGGAGGVTSQASANLSFLDSTGALTQANQFQQDANSWGAVAGLGQTIFSGAGGFKTIFGGSQGVMNGPKYDLTDSTDMKAYLAATRDL